ncbi:hypothetical protein CLI64_27270 [Nostoc sp. CENA543]|nr:hypothetical protein CLI64_27270 [Nostoc sp. CENA543]
METRKVSGENLAYFFNVFVIRTLVLKYRDLDIVEVETRLKAIQGKINTLNAQKCFKLRYIKKLSKTMSKLFGVYL